MFLGTMITTHTRLILIGFVLTVIFYYITHYCFEINSCLPHFCSLPNPYPYQNTRKLRWRPGVSSRLPLIMTYIALTFYVLNF